MRWWCADNALMMHWWCTDDMLMMHWWWADDALMMRWWCTDDAIIHSFFLPILWSKRWTLPSFLLFVCMCLRHYHLAHFELNQKKAETMQWQGENYFASPSTLSASQRIRKHFMSEPFEDSCLLAAFVIVDLLTRSETAVVVRHRQVSNTWCQILKHTTIIIVVVLVMITNYVSQ